MDPKLPHARRLSLAVMLPVLLLPMALQAQSFWVKKEFEKWSASECLRLLSNSPWARSRTIATAFLQPLEQRSAVPGRDQAPRVTYTALLWSALPVRQAEVRLAQLSPEFRKLDARERRAEEARQSSLLAEKYPDRILVRVEYATTAPAYMLDLMRYWQSRPADLWKQAMYLNTDSGRHLPVEVRMDGERGGVFVLAFPRNANGEPVIRLADKAFSVEFESPAIGVLPRERVLLEFRLKDMMLNGQPVF